MQPVGIFRTYTHCLANLGDQWFRLEGFSFDALFRSDSPRAVVEEMLADALETEPPLLRSTPFLPPLESQEIWAAGVTYYRSRSARMEEAEQAGGDIFYDKVYEAPRPELFFKSTAARARGHLAEVGIRADSTWDVPEPELTLAINHRGEVFGATIGDDMSSRSIEGENPLYLPQAKLYTSSCALGPALWIGTPPGPESVIRLEIYRDGGEVFSGETQISQIKRGFDELAGWLFRHNEFPDGALLMTGTGIVPDAPFTLTPGDEVRISIDGLGELRNPVARV
ncbi:MAG: fumarylacetoacetate hydrolase family protein [Verrucomicrobiae bacterium]|nr:fumarylacetoacetate hydrolase family protein [Verrucomicrobiae bacterium]